MITEIIEPQSATYVLHLPQEYVNKRVEVSIALAADKPRTPLREAALCACGILSGAVEDPMQWQRDLRNELERHISETALASEKTLASDWLKPEEDEAWNYL